MKLTVTSSPHVKSPATVTGIMLDVILALVPALVAAVWLFGPRALLLTAVCVGSAMLSEFVAEKIMKRPVTLGDLSAVVTGLLLAFNLPASIPLWMAAIGSACAVIVVKQMFGGLGQNFVNPAITGRIILLVSFSSAMTSFPAPRAWMDKTADAVTTATPLATLSQLDRHGDLAAQMEELPSLLEMFLGKIGGSMGEVCALALLIGGIFLLARRVISPIIPCAFIGTVAVIMLIAGRGNVQFMLYELLSGGLLLGAIFMATDYVTCPVNKLGKLIFAVGCGVITAVIRLFSNLPEGVSYSIMIMNILVPLIEKATLGKPFGAEKKKKGAKEAA